MLISEKLSLSIIAASESGNTLLNLGEIYPSAISAGASGIWSNGVDRNGDALIVAPLMRITNMRIALRKQTGISSVVPTVKRKETILQCLETVPNTSLVSM